MKSDPKTKGKIQDALVGFSEKEFKNIVSRAGLAQAFYLLAITSVVGGAITFAWAGLLG